MKIITFDFSIVIAYLFRKDHPYGPWSNHQPNSAKLIKEGCHMIHKGIKNLIKRFRFAGITLNIGFIGLNFAGGSS